MKKFINIALCLSIISGAIPMGASAKSEPIFLESGSDHWEYTSISGDINGDGTVSVADALLFQKCFMNKYNYIYDERFDESKLDVNFDGSFDVFDLIQIRKLVINPENAEKQTWTIDILNTDAEIPTYDERAETWDEDNLEKIITAYDEMSAYLETFMTDNDELQKYLDKYDETFFEKNNLILTPFIQERGNGILQQIGGTMKIDNYSFHDKTIDNSIFFIIGGNYNEDVGLYPITNIKMLAQITLPKSQTSADDKILYLDLQGKGLLSQQRETASYTDGTHEIIITQENGWGISANIYIKNDDSFTYVTSFYPDFYFKDGEISTEDYTITFYDDSFIIDYGMKLQISYDGEEVISLDGSETSFQSPDGQSQLHFTYRHNSGNFNSGDTGRETLIYMYLEEPDGHLKFLGIFFAEYRNTPFTADGEWSTDEDGNNVFSNGSTYSITWLDNAVNLDYQYGGDCWGTCTVSFDSLSRKIKYYWK